MQVNLGLHYILICRMASSQMLLTSCDMLPCRLQEANAAKQKLELRLGAAQQENKQLCAELEIWKTQL